MIPTSLREFRASGAPVVSLYVNRDGVPSGPRIRELLKNARTALPDLPREHEMSLRDDIATVEELSSKIDRSAAVCTAVFACGPAELFEVVELTEPVWDIAVMANEPYLRPLRATSDAAPVGLAVVDRAKAWVFTVRGNDIEKVAELDDQPQHLKNPDEGHKRNFGGWHGYSERRSRAHASALTQRHFQEAARLLSDLDDQHRFGYIVVGGHTETLDGFVELLHPSLRSKLAGTFTADPRTLDRAQVRDMARDLVGQAREQAELSAIDNLLDQALSGQRGVVGLKSVLFAANLHAVEHMLVAGSFTKPGNLCTECGWLSRNGGTCVACDGETAEVDDIVAAAIERSIADGAQVDHVRVASQLDASGIGAKLRFPIPDAI